MRCSLCCCCVVFFDSCCAIFRPIKLSYTYDIPSLITITTPPIIQARLLWLYYYLKKALAFESLTKSSSGTNFAIAVLI